MKSFKQYLEEKQFNDITLYHGYPSITGPHEQFLGKDVFLSTDKNFAIKYATDKASHISRFHDAPLYLATCKFSGNLFYIWNINERYKLLNSLPDKIKNRDKEDLIKLARGYSPIDINKNVIGKDVGDIFKNNYQDKTMVVGKDSEYVYGVNFDGFYEILNSVLLIEDNDYVYHRIKDSIPKELNDEFEPERQEIFKISGVSDIKYVRYKANELVLDKDVQKIRNDSQNKLMDLLFKYKYKTSKYNIGEKYESADNWNLIEYDLMPYIKELGYDGSVMKEAKFFTYQIFLPNSNLKIINTEQIRS